MKKTANKKESNWLYFNPNPTAKYKKNGEAYKWNKPDCCIRAFSGATHLSWIESYDTLCSVGRKNFDIPNSIESLAEALENAGFQKVSLPRPKRGESRPTVAELASKLSDKSGVFNLAGHVVAFDGGCYNDTWDCGTKAVYSYWIKKAA